MLALTRNNYEPDICFFGVAKAKKFKVVQKFNPASNFLLQQLLVNKQKKDRGVKFKHYALHGVKEYWIIDPRHKTIEKYIGK